MKRVPITASKSLVSQALAKYRQAITDVRSVRKISRADLDAAIEGLRNRLAPIELRRLSPEQLERRATDSLQGPTVARLRQLLKVGQEAEVAVRNVLQKVEIKARRLLPPDVPKPSEAEPLANTLYEIAVIREMRAVSQEHQLDRLERRYRAMTPEDRLAALAEAQLAGDEQAAFVLDFLLVDELPRLRAEKVGTIHPEITDPLQADAKLKAWRKQFRELEEARFSEEEKRLLAEWRQEADAAAREWRHEADIVTAVVQRNYVDVDDEGSRVTPPAIESFRRAASNAIGTLQQRLASGNEDALTAMKRLGIVMDEWKTLPYDEQYGIIEKALVNSTESTLNSPALKRQAAYALFQNHSEIVVPALKELEARQPA